MPGPQAILAALCPCRFACLAASNHPDLPRRTSPQEAFLTSHGGWTLGLCVPEPFVPTSILVLLYLCLPGACSSHNPLEPRNASHAREWKGRMTCPRPHNWLDQSQAELGFQTFLSPEVSCLASIGSFVSTTRQVSSLSPSPPYTHHF